MPVKHQTSHPRRSLATLRGVAIALAFTAAYAIPYAQQAPAPAQKILAVEDYPKWRTITAQEISGDGNWAAYDLSFTNVVQTESKPVLHLVRLDSGQQVEVANATSH